jgi:CRP-like cAMP-binding protein
MPDLEELIGSLKSSHFFRELSEESLALLAGELAVETFAEGEVVCGAGEHADRIYIVNKGNLSVRLPGKEGVVSRLGPGDIIGEYGMFIGVRTGLVEADTDVELLSIDYPHFKEFLMNNPSTMYELMSVTVASLLRNEGVIQVKGG